MSDHRRADAARAAKGKAVEDSGDSGHESELPVGELAEAEVCQPEEDGGGGDADPLLEESAEEEFFAEGDETVLEPNMVFHTPTCFRVPNRFGIGLSETLLITETGCEPLTQKTRDLHLVPA